MGAAAAEDGPLDPRQAILLALAGPCRLLEKVATERDQHRHAKARIDQATEHAPFRSREVMKIIDELVASAAMIGAVAGALGEQPGAAGSS